VKKYHRDLVLEHGASAEGVGWKDCQSQQLRFQILSGVFQRRGGFSVLDVGCGVGALLGFLRDQGFENVQYTGIDVAAESLELARAQYHDVPGAEFLETTIDRLDRKFDYAVSSGIYNLKLEQSEHVWLPYVLKMIDAQFEACKIASAFNCLTSYRDFSAPDLYYSNPSVIFDHCKQNLSKFAALRHDYPLWEFTVFVRREAVE
jgi:SAM-dependent methyltransferase